MDPTPESSGARQPTEESTAPSAGLGGDERLVSMIDGSAAAPEATVGTTGSSGAEARLADVMPKSRVEKPAMTKEQMVLPAMAEEDEVEEIERDEPRPQAVRIL